MRASKLEAWDIPIECTRDTHKEYHDKSIPIEATSYDQNIRPQFFRRLRGKIKDFVWGSLIKPYFERETNSDLVWRSDFESRAAFLALAFSASTLFRFPFACIRFGGGIFFAVYVLIILFVMQPIMFTLLILGRLQRTGLAKYPLLYLFAKGMPLVLLYMSLVFVTHNNIVLGYSGAYVLAQLVDSTPDVCTFKMKRHSNCTAYKEINPALPSSQRLLTLSPTSHLSTDLFFRYYIEGDKWREGKWFFFSAREWRYYAGMIVVFLLVLLATYKNIVNPLSRMIIYGTFALPLCLLGFTIFQLVYEGGALGLWNYVVVFKWGSMLSLDFWAEAWNFAFCSCFPGYGLLSVFGNYKTSVKGYYLLTWIICIAIILFSGLSVSVIATELGIIENLAGIQSYFAVIAEQAAISYICLANVLVKLSSVWPPLLFYVYITLFGVWTQVVANEICIIHTIDFCNETFPSLGVSHSNRAQLALGIIVAQLILIVSFGTTAGPFIYEAHIIFAGSWAACVICILRIYAATRFYGYEIFHIRLEIMLGTVPPKYFETQMRYIVLPLLGIGFVFLSANLFFEPYISTPSAHDQLLPSGFLVFGILINVVPVLILFWYFVHLEGCKRNKVSPGGARRRLNSSTGNFHEGDRMLERRKAVYTTHPVLGHADSMLIHGIRQNWEREANEIYATQVLQKRELENLLSRQRSLLDLEADYTSTFLSPVLMEHYPDAISYFKKRTPENILNKDVAYLERLLRNYSVDNIFVAAKTSDKPTKTRLMHDTLTHQRDLDKYLPTPTTSRNNLFKAITETHIKDGLLRKLYVDHIQQELGEPYANACDLSCTDEFKSETITTKELLLAPRVINKIWSEPVEYVIKYRVREREERGLHILVLEGMSHPVLMRLPAPEPISFRIQYPKVEGLSPEKRYHVIVKHVLDKLFREHSNFFTDPQDVPPSDLQPNKYKNLIMNHFGLDHYSFLNKNEVVIAIIELPEDEDKLRLEHQFLSPIDRDHGWLKIPRQRRDRQEQLISIIEHMVDPAHRAPETTTFANTVQDILDKNELLGLKQKLMRAPSDIKFIGDEASESSSRLWPDEDSDSSVEALPPSQFQRFKDSTLQLVSAENLAALDKDEIEFREFLLYLKNWKVASKRDLHHHHLNHNSKDDPEDPADGTVHASPKKLLGRRNLSDHRLPNFEEQRIRLFPMGEMPMRSIRRGVSLPHLEWSQLSIPAHHHLNVSTLSLFSRVKKKLTRYREDMDKLSTETVWSQTEQHDEEEAELPGEHGKRKSRKHSYDTYLDDLNNDRRYMYSEIGPRHIEIELRDRENIVKATSKDSISSKYARKNNRSLFNLLKIVSRVNLLPGKPTKPQVNQ